MTCANVCSSNVATNVLIGVLQFSKPCLRVASSGSAVASFGSSAGHAPCEIPEVSVASKISNQFADTGLVEKSRRVSGANVAFAKRSTIPTPQSITFSKVSFRASLFLTLQTAHSNPRRGQDMPRLGVRIEVPLLSRQIDAESRTNRDPFARRKGCEKRKGTPQAAFVRRLLEP